MCFSAETVLLQVFYPTVTAAAGGTFIHHNIGGSRWFLVYKYGCNKYDQSGQELQNILDGWIGGSLGVFHWFLSMSYGVLTLVDPLIGYGVALIPDRVDLI